MFGEKSKATIKSRKTVKSTKTTKTQKSDKIEIGAALRRKNVA